MNAKFVRFTGELNQLFSSMNDEQRKRFEHGLQNGDVVAIAAALDMRVEDLARFIERGNAAAMNTLHNSEGGEA